MAYVLKGVTMDIKINKNENLSLAIKKALVNEGAKQETFTASVWNKILDLVDMQNQENKTNGEQALYSGGSRRKPADWKHNYKVFANQVLKFSEKIWSQIRSAVGLDTNVNEIDTPKFTDVKPEQLSNGNSLVKNFDVDLTTVPKIKINIPDNQTENQQASPRTAKKGVAPDEQVPQAKTDIPSVGADEIVVPQPIEETPVQNVKAKIKKQKVAKPVVEEKTVKNADDSTTTITTTKNSDNSSVILEVNNKQKGNYIITTEKQTITSADGKTVTIKTSRFSASKSDVESGKPTVSDSLGGSEVTTTYNEDGTKKISFSIIPKGEAYLSNRIQKSTYSVDENGNIFSNLKDGGNVTISSNVQSHYWGKEAEIKITDKDGKETSISLRIKDHLLDNDGISGSELVAGSLVSAISGLSEDALKDFKMELSAIETDEKYFAMYDTRDGIYRHNDTIAMRTDGGFTSRVLTHELGHAVDDNALNNMQSDENKQAFDDLIKLIKDKNVINDSYALTNSHEFFAEYYAHKEGYSLADDKELFDKLENIQDKELKAAYEKIKTICDNIINETRNKPQTERVNMTRQEKDKKNNAESEFIKEHRAEIENIFGKEASSSITSDNDFIKLYYQKSYLEGKENEAKELLNALLDTRSDLLE